MYYILKKIKQKLQLKVRQHHYPRIQHQKLLVNLILKNNRRAIKARRQFVHRQPKVKNPLKLKRKEKNPLLLQQHLQQIPLLNQQEHHLKSKHMLAPFLLNFCDQQRSLNATIAQINHPHHLMIWN